MNMRINGFIIVEDRDGIEWVRTTVEYDMIEANGGAVNREALAVIQNAQETRGAVALANPDFPGDGIGDVTTEHVPGVKYAYIDREKAKNGRGKIGIEHTHPDDIKTALMYVSLPFEEEEGSIDESVLIDLGLIIGKDTRCKRGILGRKLHIGYSNDKRLLEKLSAFGYIEGDVRCTLSIDKESK